jgi:hypothetical protein
MGPGVLAHREAAQEIAIFLNLGHGLEFHNRVSGPQGDAGVDRPAKVYDSGK